MFRNVRVVALGWSAPGLAALLVMHLLAGCTRTHPVELVFSLVDPEPEPLAYELRVFEASTQSCAGAEEASRALALRSATLTPDDAFEPVEALPSGRYTFAVWGRVPSTCVPALFGCADVNLGASTRVQVQMHATTWTGPACEPGTCDGAGHCVETDGDGDGGPPDAMPVDGGPPPRPCASVSDCGPAGLFTCDAMACRACTPERAEGSPLGINPGPADLRRGVAVTSAVISAAATFHAGAAYDTGSAREAAVVSFVFDDLALGRRLDRQDLSGIWPELTEPESMSLASSGSEVFLIVNNLREPLPGRPDLVFFGSEVSGDFIDRNSYPHGPDDSPVLGRMISVGGGRPNGSSAPFDVRHVWRLRGQMFHTMLASSFGNGEDYRDTEFEPEIVVGDADYDEMVGSAGEWAVMPSGDDPALALFFNAWRGHSGANPDSMSTARLSGRTGRFAFAYMAADAYVLGVPVGDQLQLHRVQCSPTVACRMVDAGPATTTTLTPGASMMALQRIGDGLALGWTDPDAGIAHVSVFDAGLERVADHELLSIAGEEAFADVQISVAERVDGGTELLLVAGVRGPGAGDDEVRAAGLRFLPSCP